MTAIFTPETISSIPAGRVVMAPRAGYLGGAVTLSSTGETIYPNSSGRVVVPLPNVVALSKSGWIEVVAPNAFVSNLPFNPYPASGGYYPTATASPLSGVTWGAQTISGLVVDYATNAAAPNIRVAVAIDGAPFATTTSAADGTWSVSVASLAAGAHTYSLATGTNAGASGSGTFTK